MTTGRQTCEKLTQRHRVCGRELLPNTKCPGGYLHVGAPRYPRLWPAATVLAVGTAVLLSYAWGAFMFIGPFVNGGGATVGTTVLVEGSTLTLGRGQAEGLYAVGTCPKEASDPTVLLATLVGGGATIAVYPSASQPYFTERPLLLPFSGVRQCATFTAPRAATYTVTFVSAAAGELGLVPASQLYRVTLYHLVLWLSLATVVGAGSLVAVLRRRRDNARDPSEIADIANDPIAKAALENEAIEILHRADR